MKAMIDFAISEKFITESSGRLVKFYSNPLDIIEYFENYIPSEYDFEILKKVKKD